MSVRLGWNLVEYASIFGGVPFQKLILPPQDQIAHEGDVLKYVVDAPKVPHVDGHVDTDHLGLVIDWSDSCVVMSKTSPSNRT